MPTKTKAETNGEATAPPPEVASISLSRIETERLEVPIMGTTPLICHRFSEKAKRMMLDNMQGRKNPREIKDPQAEYEAAFYKFDDGRFGHPTLAFKDATVGGARFYGSSVTMTGLRQSLFFVGTQNQVDGMALTEIVGEPVMREDVVRVNRGGTDLRYRPQFNEWTATLTIVYVKAMLTRDSVLSLIEAGGMGVGVGEWRVEKSGDFGTYQINPDEEVTIIG